MNALAFALPHADIGKKVTMLQLFGIGLIAGPPAFSAGGRLKTRSGNRLIKMRFVRMIFDRKADWYGNFSTLWQIRGAKSENRSWICNDLSLKQIDCRELRVAAHVTGRCFHVKSSCAVNLHMLGSVVSGDSK